MPKRIPTPPPGDDEPKYLTVWYPYPAHANMELEPDQRAFCYWISKIIGAENLFAFFHKPTAQNMVIIEVNRQYRGFKQLLGEHKWNETLRDPLPEEKNRSSKVYWCTYDTGRKVEKHGWKRKMVKETWFTKNGKTIKECTDAVAKFKDEYPESSWCDIPREHVTALEMCRQIPRETPVAAMPRPPIVGSNAWLRQKDAPVPAPSKKVPAAAAVVTPPSWSKVAKSAAQAVKDPLTPRAPPMVRIRSDQGPNTAPKKSWAQSVAGERPPEFATASHPKSGVNVVLPDTCPPGLKPMNKAASSPASFSSGAATGATSGSEDGVAPMTHSSSSDVSTSASPITGDNASTTDLPAVDSLNLSPDPDEGWEVRASAVMVADSIVTGKPLAEEAAEPVPAYNWDVEEEDDDKPPVCTIHGETCKKGICGVQERNMRLWEQKQLEKGKTIVGPYNGKQKTSTFFKSPEEIDSDDEAALDFVVHRKKKTFGGGSGGGRGGRRGRGRAAW